MARITCIFTRELHIKAVLGVRNPSSALVLRFFSTNGKSSSAELRKKSRSSDQTKTEAILSNLHTMYERFKNTSFWSNPIRKSSDAFYALFPKNINPLGGSTATRLLWMGRAVRSEAQRRQIQDAAFCYRAMRLVEMQGRWTFRHYMEFLKVCTHRENLTTQCFAG